MKKWLMIIFILQGFGFIGITIYKNLPNSLTENNRANLSQEEEENSDVMLFWQYYNKATNQRTSTQFNKAIENYRSALNINPTHKNSLYYIGNMHLVTGNYEAAKKSWEKLIEVNPSSARGHFQLGTLYSCPDKDNDLYNLQSAAQHFRKTAQLNQEITGPLLELAKIHLLKNNPDSAAHILKDVVASNFRSMEAFFLQGYLAWKKRNNKKATNLLNKSVAINEGSDPESANVGEGDTKKGADPMETGSGTFNLFSEQIDLLIENLHDKSTTSVDEVFSQFEKKAGLP